MFHTACMMKRIRVLLVDDQREVRRGLRMRLELEPDIDVVGEAADGAAAVSAMPLVEPDVALMDVEMPVMDGITATERICSGHPGCAVVVLSLHDDAATRLRAKTAGARAFVAKHQIGEALLDAIRGAAGRPPA